MSCWRIYVLSQAADRPLEVCHGCPEELEPRSRRYDPWFGGVECHRPCSSPVRWPQVATDAAGNIFVVWENDTASALGILFSRSIDGGQTFSAPVFLSTNMGGSVSPQMLVDLVGNIDVVWEDDSVGAADISYSRSADSGISFSIPKSL